MKSRPTVDRILELFEYKGGEIVRKVHKPHARPGRLGNIKESGYARITVDGCNIYAHHIVWVLHYGEWPSKPLDHKNGVRSDNRIENLRLAEPYQNQANQKMSCRNRVGFKGVTKSKYGKFHAMIQKHGKAFFLGSYDTAQDAHKAYCAAALTLHGEFARLS